MKKVTFKLIISIILIVLISEFCISTNFVYAESKSAISSEEINAITNLAGGIISLILWLPKLITMGGIWFFNVIFTDSIADESGIDSTVSTSISMTPFDIFFNKYKILNVNFFDISDGDTIADNMHKSVAGWYYILRTFASAILLAILIYVGIRMALSTIAEDKAKYKQMLIDWIVSLALIFVTQYLAIFIIYINNAIVNFLKEAITAEPLGDAISRLFDLAAFGVGLNSIMAFFVYCMITFQTIFFFIAYVNRMLKVGFLILISPLISITYSIDKMGDGKAQALNQWFKEFTYTILIQPFHCVMYLAFVNTAVTLLTGSKTGAGLTSGFGTEYNQVVNGFLAILCLKFINDGEQIVRKIFNFQDDGDKTSMAAGAAIGMMAVSNAKKIGSATRKGVNIAKAGGGKLSKAIASDSKTFQKFGSVVNKASEIKGNIAKLPGIKQIGGAGKMIGAGAKKIKGVSNKFNNSKFGGKFNRYMNRTTSVALGMMGAAMSYSTGSTGALESLATGTAISKGTNQFFNTSNKSIASRLKPNNDVLDSTDKANLQKVKSDYIGNPDVKVSASDLNSLSTTDGTDVLNDDGSVSDSLDGNVGAERTALKADVSSKRAVFDAISQLKIESENPATTDERKAEIKQKISDLGGEEKAEKELRASEKKLSELDGAIIATQKLKNFDTTKAKFERYKGRKHGPSKKEITEAEKEIEQLIMQLHQADHSGSPDDEKILTEEDAESAHIMAQHLTSSINHSVLTQTGSQAVTGDIMGNLGTTGASSGKENGLVYSELSKFDAQSDTMEKLRQATENYEMLIQRKTVADELKKTESFGTSIDNFAKYQAENY